MLGLRTWTCALVAASGTVMLILDNNGSVNVGDAWSLGAALTSAMYAGISPVEATSRARKRGGDGVGGAARYIADDVRPFHPGLALGTGTSAGWVEQGSKTRRICRLRRSCSRLWVVG